METMVVVKAISNKFFLQVEGDAQKTFKKT
jgi:hypothetical protein